MSKGAFAYERLVEAHDATQKLWEAAKDANMNASSTEIIRQYVNTLGKMCIDWEVERARWENEGEA